MTSKPSVPMSEDEQRMIERLDAGEPAASPEEAQARAPYERVIERLRGAEDIEPPAGWEERLVARRGKALRQRRWGVGAAVVVIGLGVAATLLLRCASKESSALEVAVLSESREPRRGGAAVGDTLAIRTRGEGAALALLYRGARRIASCPGSAACRREGVVLVLEWQLTEPGEYHVAAIFNARGTFAPGDGGLDLDLVAARQAGARVELRKVSVSP